MSLDFLMFHLYESVDRRTELCFQLLMEGFANHQFWINSVHNLTRGYDPFWGSSNFVYEKMLMLFSCLSIAISP